MTIRARHVGLASAGLALIAAVVVLAVGTGTRDPPALPQAPPSPLPGQSLYQLRSRWTTDDRRTVRLQTLQGHVQVVAMMFTRCPSVCPALVRDIHSLATRLPQELATATRFVLVSIDPEHDTPEALATYRQELGLDAATWTLLRGQPEDVRELSAVLGFSYGAAQGVDIAHTKLITVLDRDGRIAYQQAGVDDAERIIAAITQAAGPKAP